MATLSPATILVDHRTTRGIHFHELPRESPWGPVLRVHPSDIQQPLILDLMHAWLSSKYCAGIPESAYRDVPRQLIIEELLDDGSGQSRTDYRFWSFESDVGFIEINLDRNEEPRQAVHHPDWTVVPAIRRQPQPVIPPAPPRRLDNALGIAQKLSADLDSVRCDLYLLEDRIVFGELTMYPGQGSRFSEPEHAFTRLAAGWDSTRVARRPEPPDSPKCIVTIP